MTKTRAFLLTMVATVLLDALAAWLQLPALWDRVNPLLFVRLAVIAAIGAALPRTTGITKTVILLATATGLPTAVWLSVYIGTGRAAAEYSGPAFVLAFLIWSLGSGILGAVVGVLIRRWSGSAPGTA